MPTLSEIAETFKSSYGFDMHGLYCQATGKCFGWTHIEEMESLVNLVGAESNDADEIADDIAMRVLASMRPSHKWNKFRAESLAEMRKSDPIETLAYLINRMFAPLNHRKIGIDNLLRSYEDRIRAFQIIQSWGVTDATNTMTYMLLELDAKWNLDTEYPPFSWTAFFIDAPDLAARLAILQNWYADRMIAWEKRLAAEELQTRWIRHGNVLAKPAFAAAYMESKPLSATAIKRAEKEAEKQMFGDLLFEILGNPTLDGEPTVEPKAKPKPTFVPIRKMPMSFGVKNNG